MKARIGLFGVAALAAAGLTAATSAQLLPGVPGLGRLDETLRPLTRTVGALPDRAARVLEAARIDRIAALVRLHPGQIALDPQGFPARAGELVVTDPQTDVIADAGVRGYRVIEDGELLGVGFVRLTTPAGRSLASAIDELRSLGAHDVATDQLHRESGSARAGSPQEPGRGVRIGVIDGGVAGAVEQRGFATGAPRVSDHGSAVASLIAGRAGVRGAANGAQLVVADVFGTDPAGGNATAIAKALAWLAGKDVAVVNISLVGPSNPLLARVVAAAQARGVMIVAPVGNDGPASPPSYPASYPGVIAVTAVDGRNRILIEAGRATHLDYAAPGADMLASGAQGRAMPVRGTSFAAPLVAGTLAHAYPAPDPRRRAEALATVDAAARRLGKRYGRGLVCDACRTLAR